jgi:hypothetical protein
MQTRYQARWITKQRRDQLRKTGATRGATLFDSLNGFLIVEPVGSNLGDGAILNERDADYELRDVWCTESPKKLNDARRLLGLEAEAAPATLAVAS